MRCGLTTFSEKDKSFIDDIGSSRFDLESVSVGFISMQ